MSTKQELEMYQNALDALNKIPDNYQSQCYLDYKSELEARVTELKRALVYLQKYY